MPSTWPVLAYEDWSATCDTLPAHNAGPRQAGGRLAPPEPQLQHSALRLTARGWETPPLPAPDGSGALRRRARPARARGVVEHSDGRVQRVALTPRPPVGAVTRDVLEAVRELAGAVEIDPTPQEVPWTVALDEDDEHATYDADQVGATTPRRRARR
jgi:hypothetical protein